MSSYAVYPDHAVNMSHLEVQMHCYMHSQQTSKYASCPTKDDADNTPPLLTNLTLNLQTAYST